MTKLIFHTIRGGSTIPQTFRKKEEAHDDEILLPAGVVQSPREESLEMDPDILLPAGVGRPKKEDNGKK